MNFILNEYPTLLIILTLALATIITVKIIRFTFNLIKYLYLTQKYSVKYDKETRKYLKNHTNKPEKIIERNQEKEMELINETRRLNQAKELSNVPQETTIVGIAKPKGIWTKYVTEQKISWLRAMVGTKAESDNFWRNMINAQSKSQSKEQSKSR